MEGTQFVLLSAIILVGALLIAGGAVIALRGRRRGESPASDETPAPATAEAPNVENGATPARRESLSRLSDWQRKLPPDVVLLSRDAATGSWLVEIEGQRYRSLSDVHDDRIAIKIAAALDGMKVFAGLTPAPASGPPFAAPAAANPAPAPPSASPAIPAAAPGAHRLSQAKYPAPQGSIIAQIESILQRELLQHPELGDRHIHMGATPDGSLLIEVDTDFFRSPDEIPDPQVRTVVLTAVRTWEKSG